MRRVHATIVALKKAISITYSERVFVDLGIQHAMRMHHFFYPWPAPLYIIFPRYPITGSIFGTKSFRTSNMFWFSLQCVSEIFNILRGMEQNMIKNRHVKNSLFTPNFIETWIFSTEFGEIIKCQISRKSFQLESSLPCGQTDRQTNMAKLIVAFRNFANASKYSIFRDVVHKSAQQGALFFKCRTVSWYTINCRWILAAKKYGCLCTDLTNLNKCSTALCADLL